MYNQKMGNIEQFDAEYFEHILDHIAKTRSGKRLWAYLGMQQGERVYKIGFNDPRDVAIMVRSSVHGTLSASTGADSIRCWLVDKDNGPIAVKVSAFVTRRPRWPERLKETLTKLRQMRLQAGDCCGQPRHIRRAKKNDKLFCRCEKCDKFGDWLK